MNDYKNYLRQFIYDIIYGIKKILDVKVRSEIYKFENVLILNIFFI